MNHGIEFLATDLHTDHLKIPLLDFCRQSSACRTLLCCHSNSTSCILGTQRTFSTLRWDVVPILLLQTIYITVERHERVHYSCGKWEHNQVMAWAEHSGQNPVHFYWSFLKKKKKKVLWDYSGSPRDKSWGEESLWRPTPPLSRTRGIMKL